MEVGFSPITTAHTLPLNLDKFRKMIAEHAYYKAEKRGFIAGHEMEDWLEAEGEVINRCFYWVHERVFDMKRNKIIESFNQAKQMDQKQRIAFHEAGHATAIYLNNKARNLPPVFFQIMLKDLNGKSEEELRDYQATDDDCIARVEGGRLIEWLPSSIDALVHKTPDQNDAVMHFIKDYMVAFEADIINLLIGPLAEAKYIYKTDGELFNHQLVNLHALKNYGGSSDLALANEYLQSFSACKQQQDKKLDELFVLAFNFINDWANWAAITRLADYILNNNKNIISCEEVISLVEY